MYFVCKKYFHTNIFYNMYSKCWLGEILKQLLTILFNVKTSLL